METMKELTLGERIRKIRKTLKLNQKDFAEKLNASMTSLSEIESGKHNPGFNFLYNLAAALKVNLYYLFFGKGDMFCDIDAAPALLSIEDFAVNTDHVKEFLMYFQQSPTLQYFILSQFRSYLMRDRDAVLWELEEYKRKHS